MQKNTAVAVARPSLTGSWERSSTPMNNHLKSAILEFLSDEFKSSGQSLTIDTNFIHDLHQTPDELADLFHRIEDALSLTLAEEKIPKITTIGDLVLAFGYDEEDNDIT